MRNVLQPGLTCERLRTVALALHRTQRQTVVGLPALVWRTLATALS